MVRSHLVSSELIGNYLLMIFRVIGLFLCFSASCKTHYNPLINSGKKMTLELLQAQDDDRTYLLELRKLTMVEHLENAGLFLSDEQHIFRINDGFEHSSIICSSDTKIGSIKHRQFDNKIEIMQIQVHPDFQGKGFGKTILQQVINRHDSKTIVLSVLKSNPAQKLYERLGFIVTGEDEYEFKMQRVPR